MQIRSRAFTAADAQAVAGWRYAAPYDVYEDRNITRVWREETPIRALTDGTGAMCGFFCWAGEARIAAATDIYMSRPDALDFGIGLAPEWTGQHAGLFACEHALAWLRAAFSPASFRLAVYDWNARARKVYERLGFSMLAQRGEFIMMHRDERPWVDATRLLEDGIPVYPGDPPFQKWLHMLYEADGWNVSALSMGLHTGTHVDMPMHMGITARLPEDAAMLAHLNGTCQLIDLDAPQREAVTCPRVLLKTGGRGIERQDAEWLLREGVTMVGTDALSIGATGAERPVHALLLKARVTVLENAAIEGLAPGWYRMRCLPMRVAGSDGLPVRLLLREEMT